MLIRAPMHKTIPLAPIHDHPFTKQMVRTFVVSRIIDSTLVEIVFLSSLCVPYKGIRVHRFSSLFVWLFLSFRCTLFRGFEGACVNPGSFSPFVHSLVYQIPYNRNIWRSF